MAEIANNEALGPIAEDSALELRLMRNMIAAVSLAAIVSIVIAPWRVTSGLLLGGGLALFNHHWLRTSIAAAFKVETGTRPRLRAWRYLVRYLIVAMTVVAAYQLNIVSLAATIAGLCAFVAALFAEALRSFYFILTRREEC
jgi:ATP synthase I chain